MDEATVEELRQRVIEYLQKVDKAKARDIADALKEKKALVDSVVKELAKEGLVEFLYIGTSYVKLVGK